MLSQTDFYLILQEKKYIEESILIGSFFKKNYKVLFYDDALNTFNVYLDISRSGSIEIKHTINKRAKKAIPILRLDINGANHTNPEFNENFIPHYLDAKIIGLMQEYSGYKFKKENHLHYFIENYRDKWAFPPDKLGISISADFSQNIQEFCKNFNIEVNLYQKERGLF